MINLSTQTAPAADISERSLRYLRSFERHLRAENKSPSTITHYLGATRQFLEFCAAENLPSPENVSREHIELWVGKLLSTVAPASARNRYIGLRMFYTWLTEEDEIERSPFYRKDGKIAIKAPSVPETRKDVVAVEDMSRVFQMLDKEKNWRDAAIVAILYDTGLRVNELATMLLVNVNLDSGVVVIPASRPGPTVSMTKGRRVRSVRLSDKTLRYIDRYLRSGAKRRETDYLINGRTGAHMTRDGLYEVVRHVFERAGIAATISPHDLRHTSASHVAGKMSETEMMTLYGWSDPEMARHYTRQVHEQNALAAHVSASPMARLKK